MAFYYRVSKSLVPILNGDYCPNEDSSSFKIADQDLILKRGADGLWKFADSKVVASATKPSESPTEQIPWEFFSTMQNNFPLSLKIERCDGLPKTSIRKDTAVQSKHKKIEVSRRNKNESHDLVRNNAGGRVTPNVVERSFTCAESTLQVYCPLGKNDVTGGEVRKKLHAGAWVDSVDIWKQSVHLLGDNLLAWQKALKTTREEPPTRGFLVEMSAHATSVQKKEAEIAALRAKEIYAIQRAKTMSERMGKVHVKRDEALTEEGAFPSGEQIKARYQSVFGEAFERAGVQVIAFIEDTSSVEDGTEIFVREVVAPLFTATRAHALNAIQAKYRKLADAFGLPEVEEEGAEDSIARHFFLTSQQVPLLAAAKNIDEAAVLAICKAMGPRAEAVRTQMPDWAAKKKFRMSFDLLEMVRVLVWLNTAIELSDPKCYLYPRIGLTQRHVDDKRIYKEVHRADEEAYGALAADKEVEVVLPGLYFEVPMEFAPPGAQGEVASASSATVVVPVVPVQVRRLGVPRNRKREDFAALEIPDGKHPTALPEGTAATVSVPAGSEAGPPRRMGILKRIRRFFCLH